MTSQSTNPATPKISRCAACYDAHARCEKSDQTECKRCLQLGFTCETKDKAPNKKRHTGSETASNKRRRHNSGVDESLPKSTRPDHQTVLSDNEFKSTPTSSSPKPSREGSRPSASLTRQANEKSPSQHANGGGVEFAQRPVATSSDPTAEQRTRPPSPIVEQPHSDETPEQLVDNLYACAESDKTHPNDLERKVSTLLELVTNINKDTKSVHEQLGAITRERDDLQKKVTQLEDRAKELERELEYRKGVAELDSKAVEAYRREIQDVNDMFQVSHRTIQDLKHYNTLKKNLNDPAYTLPTSATIRNNGQQRHSEA